MLTACKLCHRPTQFRFALTVLKRWKAEYHECAGCGSLQVAAPEWLAEAYCEERWALDTGLVARNLLLAGRIAAFLGIACNRSEPVIDFGGGTGLLTRLLRDMGWDVRCCDRYRKPLFVDAFHISSLAGQCCSVLIASEVFEHFESPRESIAELLACAPVVIFTTELYTGQREDWWYLAPDLGQHVFFYSARGLAEFARTLGFAFVDAGVLKFLIRNDQFATPEGRECLHRALTVTSAAEGGIRPITEYLLNPYQYVGTDYELELAHARTR